MQMSGPDADVAVLHLSEEWKALSKRHDLCPRVRSLAQELIQLVPRCRLLGVDPEDVICGAVWRLLEATKAEREPAEARALLAGRANVLREIRALLDKVERAPAATSMGPKAIGGE